ncbi:ScbR family autoregulator-binding transcription factor [Kitasatospora camelliae]|uniref:ScbR family autoregulator-binding transcription factor n=1 Tax=Kitasatospora camelliae TaxID=3156397 RepID=A0AAU8JY22_9ACTN
MNDIASAATAAAEAALSRRPEPKQERAQRTRTLVLAAAAELFASKGFPATSITDIAQQVGLTKGAVYFHFKNKEDMAIAVVEANYLLWPTLLDEVRAEGLDPLQTLRELLDRTAHTFHTNVIVRATSRLQAERTLIGSQLPQPYVGWIEILTTLLAEARGAGQVRRDMTPEALARVIVAAFYGMQHISDVLHGQADLMERWAEVREVIFSSLAPR